MSAHVGHDEITPGTPVFDAAGAALGPVESSDATNLYVLDRAIPLSAIARTDPSGIHLHLSRAALHAGAATEQAAATGRIVVSLAEERLTIDTREVDLGEVIIRKRTIEEERMVPVVFRREEVEIIRREPGESWSPGDTLAANTEITRIPIRGREAIVGTQAFVAREVVIDKARITEEGHVTGTVRREHVTVEERYAQARPNLEREFIAGRGETDRTFAEAEPQYRAGFNVGSDPRYAGRDFSEIEPAVRQEYGATDQDGGDGWELLRREIRGGFEAARRA